MDPTAEIMSEEEMEAQRNAVRTDIGMMIEVISRVRVYIITQGNLHGDTIDTLPNSLVEYLW